MDIQRCRVVLVRPSIAGNIGATARVMRNFGLSDLRLVAPVADPLDEQSRKMSTHGESILHSAARVSDLSEAVGDCTLVVGTSARTGGPFRRQNVVTPAEIMPRLAESLTSGHAALVFGPEATGLTDAEVSRCHYLISIPANESYPALNLAQAVAICLYELRKACGGKFETCRNAETAPFELQERMYEKLETALRDIHFVWGDGGDALMHALRHLIGRAGPTRMEVDLLLGLARQIEWYVWKRSSSRSAAELK